MKRLFVIISVSLLVLVASVPVFGQKTDKYRWNVEVARELIHSGKPGEALQLILQIQENYGETPEVTALLKEAYYAGKEFDKVEEIVNKELALRPKDFRLYCELADVCLKTRRSEEAKTHLSKAVEVAAELEQAFREVSLVYLRNGLTSDAIDTYRLARMKVGKPDVFALDLAGLYEAMKDYKLAVDEYFLFMGSDSTKFDLLRDRIVKLIQTEENLDGVQAALGERIKKNPQDRFSQRLYGDLLFRRGNLSGAFDTYRRVDELFRANGRLILDFIQMCFGKDYFDQAIISSQHLLSTKPSRDVALSAEVLIARSQEGMEKFAEAVTAYQKIVDGYSTTNPAERRLFAPDVAYSLFQIGEINLFRLHMPDAAYPYYQRVLTEYRDSDRYPSALVRLADCRTARGDLDSAQVLLKSALLDRKAEPRAEEIKYKLAEIEFYRGNFEDASAGYSQVVADHPKGLYVNNCLERSLILGENQGLDRSLLSVFASAMRDEVQGRPDSAVEKLDQVISAKSEKLSDLAQLEKGKILQSERKFGASLEAFQKLLEQYPQSLYRAEAQKLIGDVYNTGLKDKSRAAEAYQKLLKEYDRSVWVDEVREKLRGLQTTGSPPSSGKSEKLEQIH